MNEKIIEYIKIFNLFNRKNIEIRFMHDCTILIGANGMGKTTILSIINYILRGNLELLTKYKFHSIEIKLSCIEKIIIFSKFELQCYRTALSNISNDIEISHLRKFEKSIFSQWNINKSYDKKSIEKILDGENINFGRYIIEVDNIKNTLSKYFIDFSNILKFRKVLCDLNLEIMYLPTYRRIEADIDDVLNSAYDQEETEGHRLPISRDRSYTYKEFKHRLTNNPIIKFGMTDIQKAIETIKEKITNKSLDGFSKVSGDMIHYLIQDPEQHDRPSFDLNEISIILARTGENLSEEDKETIMKLISNNEIQNKPYLIYFLNSLLELYKKQKKDDEALKGFANECNKFLADKEFIYDESKVKFDLHFINDTQVNAPNSLISLERLSSGEKQVVSILAFVYLNYDKNIIFLIDEPELSLSIYWQEKILPSICKAPACKQLIAVTHSPFIFNNELMDCALGASEYSQSI